MFRVVRRANGFALIAGLLVGVCVAHAGVAAALTTALYPGAMCRNNGSPATDGAFAINGGTAFVNTTASQQNVICPVRRTPNVNLASASITGSFSSVSDCFIVSQPDTSGGQWFFWNASAVQTLAGGQPYLSWGSVALGNTQFGGAPYVIDCLVPAHGVIKSYKVSE